MARPRFLVKMAEVRPYPAFLATTSNEQLIGNASIYMVGLRIWKDLHSAASSVATCIMVIEGPKDSVL